MFVRKCSGFILTLVVVALIATVGMAQTAEVTTWQLPSPNSLPRGIGVTPNGKVFFAEFNVDKIGLLDPITNEIRERDVGDGPSGLVVADNESVYYTLALGNALELLVFIGGGHTWPVPTPGCWPGKLVEAPSGPGQVNLWFNERLAGKVTRFAPTQITVTLPLIITPPVIVSPNIWQIEPITFPVSPSTYPGNPMLPPPIAYVPGVTTGPFTEWTALYREVTVGEFQVKKEGGSTAYVERVAVAPNGRVWFTQGMTPLSELDPDTDTLLAYGLPTGTDALGVAVDVTGDVWFTDISRPAIGRLDPTTGNVYLWSIPSGIQPFDLAFDGMGNVWFTDREADAVGVLSPVRNEIAMYPLSPNTHPVDLVIDQGGSVWFSAEGGNFVARLKILPVLGPPPVIFTAPPFGEGSSSYGIAKAGNQAAVRFSYSYDGGMGLPVWFGVEVLSEGVPLPGFDYTPFRVDEIGEGAAAFVLEYVGAVTVESDGIRFFMSLYPGGPAVALKEVEFVTTWTP